MQRWVTIALGAAVVALAVLLAYKSTPQKPQGAADAAADAPAAATGGSSALVLDAEAPVWLGADAALTLSDLLGPDDRGEAGAFRLPDKSPRSVRFGVILVTHQGAQGAPATARPKKDALDLATKLAEDAKTDFAGAVQRGDHGSMNDAGRMPRGVLEPQVEYALFTLPAGGISEVLETPRGYWIVKRIE
jgi:hypothetical protein